MRRDAGGVPPARLSGSLSPEERAIIERLSRGDRDALGELATLYGKPLKAVAGRELGRYPGLRAVLNPSDIIQTVFTQLIQNHQRYLGKGMANAPFGWVRTMVLRQVSDALDRYKKAAKRTLSRHRSLGDQDGELVDDGAETPSRIVLAREEQEQLRELLRTLPEVDQLIFRLWLYEHLTHREIGERLGMPENRVAVHVMRAKKNLRNKVEGTDPDRHGTATVRGQGPPGGKKQGEETDEP
jgi:RNA polymerase sigma-70 factor (ECF subfamily)